MLLSELLSVIYPVSFQLNSFRLAQDGTLARYLLPCSVFTFTIYSARFVPNLENGSVCVCGGGGGGSEREIVYFKRMLLVS